MSILETFVFPSLIQPYRDVTFVVKESLISYPFFGPILRSRDPVVVGRVNPREDLKIVLEEGRNRLGVKLAKRANVPVVPFALKTDAWGLGRKLKDFGKISPQKTVRIYFGNPMHISGSGKAEHNTIIEFISARLDDWRRK
jgi:1-acyl-sn-glycerol-3-phosphate acyltransferase